MKLKKTKIGLAVALSLVMAVLLSGCGWLDRIMHPPTLDERQALILTQLVGVANLDDYYAEAAGLEETESTQFGFVNSAPGWAADYEGEGLWRVTGPVTTENWGVCQTAWYLSESDSKLTLISLECEE